MTSVHRVLPPEPVTSLDEHVRRRGGRGLENARAVEPEAVLDELEAAGLRGRGGAGFPTHLKWRAVVENRSALIPSTVVVNGAEGEPGTYKDRTILLSDPYSVIEGAIIAARTVGADTVVFGLKASAPGVTARVRDAIGEMDAAGWTDGVAVEVFEGPDEYLYGEETALLEALGGRAPFPRLAPPFRRGLDEMVGHADDVATGSGLSGHVEMAEPGNATGAPPTLVANVETLANVPGILARGGSWFRTEGTDRSPGTIVCTVTGSVQHAGVAEFMMGTPLREVIESISGGAQPGRRIVGVLSGVSNPILTEDQLDTPVSYEAMAAIGSGLGSAGFIVLDDHDDPVATIAGVSRFLAVESCGQCTACKQDGLSLAAQLEQLCHNDADDATMAAMRTELDRVTDGARCYLATQQQVVVTSLLDRFGPTVDAHLRGSAPVVEPTVIAELRRIDDGTAEIDLRHRDKQPDWTYDDVDSGQAPADRLGDHRTPQPLDG
jgi:NADH-quinone oxidoreductase subunit F